MTYTKTIPTAQAEADRELLASLGANNIEVSTAAPKQEQAAEQDTAVPSNPSLPAHQQSKAVSGAKGATSDVEERALALLGSGIAAEQVAAALGVTPSRIAQLLSVEVFSKQVADLRYQNLQAHNVRDDAYDSLEDTLLGKLKNALPLMIKPRDILDALTRVNAAKRRGQSAPSNVGNQQTVVTLVLPTIITEKFAIDLNNQVTRAGSQDLLTMPSGNLLKQVEDAADARLEARQAGQQRIGEQSDGLQEEHRD